MKETLLLAAGLTLFLFGMMKLSTKVQQLLTARIRGYIRYAVKRPISGLITGCLSTILFQSSSATTVLIIGMVSAGLITFYNSLSIILGADIGTVLTVQLVVWHLTDVSPLLIVLGGLVWLFGREKWQRIGENILYFGLIFFGLSISAAATAPLKGNPDVVRFFQETQNPLWGLALGLVFTGIVHASVIPISILVILAQQGLVSLGMALPIVFGANIGSSVTALLAGTVAGLNGKRAALSHFLFKVVGAAICLLLLPVLVPALSSLPGTSAQQIVYGHLFFNLVIVVVFFFILRPTASFIEKLVPGREEELPLWPEFLDDAYLDRPEEALDAVKKELGRGMTLVQKMYAEAMNLRLNYREDKRRNIDYIEFVVNHMRSEIVDYLRKISNRQMTNTSSQELFTYTALADDIERIGNHVIIVAGLLEDKFRRRIKFSPAGNEEMDVIRRRVQENLSDAAFLIETRNPECIRNITLREDGVDEKVKEARDNHLVRFHQRICQAEAGPLFLEMLIHLERISDHCQNIADYISDLR
ncbi:MAG: Na/Pi cotransporter family protein [Smithellaceae bacterium]|nr:Na/Pi cotransporter family protein [Smithellaceae bacterium]